MRNGTTVLNPPVKVTEKWTNRLLSRLRPGGVWVVPRSVSTVLVLSHDPKLAELHCIFPDPKLVAALMSAGWQIRPRHRTKENI